MRRPPEAISPDVTIAERASPRACRRINRYIGPYGTGAFLWLSLLIPGSIHTWGRGTRNTTTFQFLDVGMAHLVLAEAERPRSYRCMEEGC
jgi:hypothetical protein